MDNIRHSVDGTRLIVFPEGHIDSANAQDFEETINELRSRGSYDEIELNCGQLQYISSAGLRVLVNAAQILDDRDGEVKVLNANKDVRNIFDITGLTDPLGVE